MTQGNSSEGSEGPDRVSGKRDIDLATDGEDDMVPFKKRVRFLSSDDLKEVANDKMESSDANNNDLKVSSVSALADDGEVNKMEIIPTTCNEDNFSASLSQLATSESGGTGKEPGGAGDGKHEKEIKELIEDTCSGTCSPTYLAFDRSSEDERLEEDQNSEKEDGELSDNGGEYWKEETAPNDVVGEEHIPNAEGGAKLEDADGASSPNGPLVECEADVTDEAQEDAVKDGDDGSGEEPSKEDNNESKMIQDGDACGKDETATEGEDGGGNDGVSPTNTMIESNYNDGNGERDGEEQKQLAEMEDGGNENIRNNEPGVEEQINKSKEPVEADHHQEQGQPQTETEDGGDGNAADVVFSGEEVQDKKGKKPAENSRNDSESGPDCYPNAPDVGGNKEQPDHQGTNLDAVGGAPSFLVSVEGDHDDQMQQADEFEDHDGETGNKNADANSSAIMAIQCDMQTQQDPMTTIDLGKRTLSIYEQGEGSQEARKKGKYGSDKGSTSALCLDGDDGYKEPPMQQADHSFMLFGVPIPCEQEPGVARNTNNGLESGRINIAGGDQFANDSAPMQQPRDGIQLFGVYMTEEPVATRGIQLFGVHITEGMQNRDQGNSQGGGESSMGPPKSGLRLFGYEF